MCGWWRGSVGAANAKEEDEGEQTHALILWSACPGSAQGFGTMVLSLLTGPGALFTYFEGLMTI